MRRSACPLCAPQADIGVIVVRQLFDRGAVEQQTTLQGNAEHLGGFEIDDHLSVRSLLLFNDGTPEACRSFAS